MSQDNRDAKSDPLIEAWIEERTQLEELETLPNDESGNAKILTLLAGARRAQVPELSDTEADRVFERVRSRIRARRASSILAAPAWLRWAAATAAIAAGLVAWTYRPGPARGAQAVGDERVLVKEILFESVQKGKVVRFEMQLYRITNQKAKEAPRGQTPSL